MRAICRFVVVAVVFGLGTSAVAAQSQKGVGPYNEKMIEIDGSKNPGAIPLWLVWSTTFRLLSAVPRGQSPDLRLSTPETEMVVAAAKDAVEADVKCNKAITERLAVLKSKGKKPIEVYRENQKLVVGCRQEQLDRADELMNRLAVESQTTMFAFVEERRRGISRMVPEKEMAFFRSPR